MTRTAADHIMTLRIRLRVLEDNLIPAARRDKHECVEWFEQERDALRWVLAHWDASRRLLS